MSDPVTDAFAALSTVEPPISWDDVAARTEGEHRPVELTAVPAPRSPRRLVAVALAAAAIVAIVVVVATRDTDRPRVSTNGGIGPAPTSPTPTTLPATSSLRTFPVAAWTGTQYLVWSGEAGSDTRLRADGWAYDPATNQTTEIPVAPIAPRTQATGVWSGEELIVCCGSGYEGRNHYRTDTAAAYRPETRTWRRLADPPRDELGEFGAAVWTGDEMIVVFQNGAIAYSVARDRWRVLADPPPLARRPEAAWTGRDVIVWSPEYQYKSALDRGYLYHPATDTWTALPEVPDTFGPNLGSMVWTGDEVIVYGQSPNETSGTGARLRLGDDHWTPLPDAGLRPIDWYEGTPGSQTLAWDGPAHRLVVWPVHGDEYGTAGPPILTFDPDDGGWREVARPNLGYEPDLRSAGGVVFRPDRDRPVVTRFSG
jgi:hypothetical protein